MRLHYNFNLRISQFHFFLFEIKYYFVHWWTIVKWQGDSQVKETSHKTRSCKQCCAIEVKRYYINKCYIDRATTSQHKILKSAVTLFFNISTVPSRNIVKLSFLTLVFLVRLSLKVDYLSRSTIYSNPSFVYWPNIARKLVKLCLLLSKRAQNTNSKQFIKL